MKLLNLIPAILICLIVFKLSDLTDIYPALIIQLLPNSHQTYQNTFPTFPLMLLFLDQLKAIIEKNLSKNDLNVHLLEKELGMSRTKLHRKISESAHMSATAFIRFIRLTKASQILRGGKEKTISKIAKEVGFSSLSYFTRCFHKIFGMSPSDWRNKKIS